jgi:hypothetical protein
MVLEPMTRREELQSSDIILILTGKRPENADEK